MTSATTPTICRGCGSCDGAVAGRSDRDADRLAERILPGKMAIGERLVDDGDPGRRSGVALLDHAPAQQPDAERVERLRVDLVEVGDRLLPRLRAPAGRRS